MGPTKSRPALSRRGFLKLMAASGAAAAGGYFLYEYTPWLDYDQQANHNRRPFEKTLDIPAKMLELVRYATLAANGHNTQPWKFAIKENAIEIHPDYSRRLPVVDPHDRELWISLGCALENLLVAARAIGYAPEVTYPDTVDFIHVRLATDSPQNDPLFDAIPVRQNTRSKYDNQRINSGDLDRIQAMSLEPGVDFRLFTSLADLELVLEYVNQGNLSQYAEKIFLDELNHWLRFNKKEALSKSDGLYTRCTGNPEVPRWIGQLFVEGAKPQQQAVMDSKKLRSSPFAILVSSEVDDKVSWVRVGQVYERIALKLTSLNIKSAFINQPIEVAQIRSQFPNAFDLRNSLPQLLFRVGNANPMPRSLRRPVEQVLV